MNFCGEICNIVESWMATMGIYKFSWEKSDQGTSSHKITPSLRKLSTFLDDRYIIFPELELWSQQVIWIFFWLSQVFDQQKQLWWEGGPADERPTQFKVLHHLPQYCDSNRDCPVRETEVRALWKPVDCLRQGELWHMQCKCNKIGGSQDGKQTANTVQQATGFEFPHYGASGVHCIQWWSNIYTRKGILFPR